VQFRDGTDRKSNLRFAGAGDLVPPLHAVKMFQHQNEIVTAFVEIAVQESR